MTTAFNQMFEAVGQPVPPMPDGWQVVDDRIHAFGVCDMDLEIFDVFGDQYGFSRNIWVSVEASQFVVTETDETRDLSYPFPVPTWQEALDKVEKLSQDAENDLGYFTRVLSLPPDSEEAHEGLCRIYSFPYDHDFTIRAIEWDLFHPSYLGCRFRDSYINGRTGSPLTRMLGRDRVLRLLRKIPREHRSSKEDFATLESLPDQVTIYRGAGGEVEEAATGTSWSLSREVAEWFAARQEGRPGFVLQAEVDREDILALIQQDGREENEVIIDSGTIRNVTVIARAAKEEVAA